MGRPLQYIAVTAAEYAEGLIASGFPAEEAMPIAGLISEVLDGRNSYLTDGVERALGEQQFPDHRQHHWREKQLRQFVDGAPAEFTALDAALNEMRNGVQPPLDDVLEIEVDEIGVPRAFREQQANHHGHG